MSLILRKMIYLVFFVLKNMVRQPTVWVRLPNFLTIIQNNLKMTRVKKCML